MRSRPDDRNLVENLHRRIDRLVADEHALREAHAAGFRPRPGRLAKLLSLEETLDPTWDPLRQHQARHDAGQGAAGAREPSTEVVEDYLG